MILDNDVIAAAATGITRTCGGDPKFFDYEKAVNEYYPHMRGWSSRLRIQEAVSSVLPAHAGVILLGKGNKDTS